MDFNIIRKDSVPVCPVDASGCFTAEVTDFAGQYVKVGCEGRKLEKHYSETEEMCVLCFLLLLFAINVVSGIVCENGEKSR